MLTKETIKQSIDSLPDSFTFDDVIERLLFLKKIEEGLEQSKSGKLVDNQSVREKIVEWSK